MGSYCYILALVVVAGAALASAERAEDPLVDDQRLYLRPGISSAELLRARGYTAQEYSFFSGDGYRIPLVRGTNPLVNGGQRGAASKLPLLFSNAILVTSASYLVNSVGVKPRLYDTSQNWGNLSVAQLMDRVQDDPAVKSLPFLAMNLGHECWFMDRRGYTGPRIKRGQKRRTLADALRAVPTALIGNSLGGFTLDANLSPNRPFRVPTDSLDPLTSFQNGTIRLDPTPAPAPAPALTLAQGRPVEGAAMPVTFPEILARMRHSLERTLADGENGEEAEEEDFIETFDPDYWNFSLDEQAQYDLPQAIDLVLEKTGQPKVHLVGLSGGGALILLTLAQHPELAAKVSRAVLWSPAVNLGSRTDDVRLLGQVLVPLLQGYAGPVPFVYMIDPLRRLLQDFCERAVTACEGAFDEGVGFSGGQAPVRSWFIATYLAPTSANELKQLAQMTRTQRPCKYSFNTKEKNLLAYGTVEPPCYDLGAIELRNISFYVGANDLLVSPDDVATSQLQMSVPSELHIIKGKDLFFNHLGSLMHENTAELVILPSLLDIERSEAQEMAA